MLHTSANFGCHDTFRPWKIRFNLKGTENCNCEFNAMEMLKLNTQNYFFVK